MFISEIRENFLRALPSSEGEIFQWAHPEKGPKQDILSTHLWLRRGDPKRLLISISGVHGPEAFIGSRIQQELLKNLSHLQRENPPTLLFIHNFNSFGSAWVRRTNHQNIDLNRNSWVEKPMNSAFINYQKWLSAQNLFEFWTGVLAKIPSAFANGLREMSGTIAKGQTEFPKALFFAGIERSFEIRQLQNFLSENFKAAAPEKIFVLDIHTGLGRAGHDSLIVDPGISNSLNQKLKTHFQHSLVDPSKEKGFYPAFGTLGSLFQQAFPHAELCHLTQEFGTFGPLKVLQQLAIENSVWWTKGPRTLGRSDLLLETFYPRSQSWQDKVLRLGVHRFHQLNNFI